MAKALWRLWLDENHLSFVNETESESLLRIKIIEDIFAEELAFLYYLNLNSLSSSGWSEYMKLPTEPGLFRLTEDQSKQISLEVNLGNKKERLMTILAKDKDIKKWFTDRLSDILYYRNQTL